jgi:two-component system OmpR family sensor kinase
LVLSYVLLVLLTLGVVGAVILRLVEDYVERQEREYLTANAEAVAHQASSLIWPSVQLRELQNLARTSGFLGNARVRILDRDQRALADSWSGAEKEGAVWILPSQAWRVEMARQLPSSHILKFPAGAEWPFLLLSDEASMALEDLPPGLVVTVVRTWEDVWGTRFSYEVIEKPDQLSSAQAVRVTAPRSQRVSSVPIGDADEPLGYVEMSQGTDHGTEVLQTIRQAFLFAAGGALLLAILVGLLVSRRLVAPLRELTGVADRMSGGELSTRAPVRGGDEIGQLAGQFNEMAERLESSFAELAAERDALRCFIADASHELRTPITALKSFNELLQGAAADDPAARAEFLAESQVQLQRLEWVTSHLLHLSRLDAGLVDLEVGNHDVGDLIESAASAFKPVARDRGIAFSVSPPMEALEVQWDRTRIELALCNLLDNAFKYTPAGGQIEISAERRGEFIRLWVRDNGPGIDPEDQPHIFERFYRGRDARAEGSGLGLTIVQSVVQAHGGRVSIQSDLGVGSLFVLELPPSIP